MENSVEGDHTTNRDGRAYKFTATWEHTEQGIRWRAKIFRNGEFVEEDVGTISTGPSVDFDGLVLVAVRMGLEQRVPRG